MTLFEIILAVMLSGPTWRGDLGETPEERRKLYAVSARAIAAAAGETKDPIRAAAVLIALGRNETAWSRYVLEGRCMDGPRDMQCDYSARQGRPLAIGPFQVHGWCQAAWTATAGSHESILASARCALQYVGRGLKRCSMTHHNAWAGSFAAYRGQRCSDADRVGRNYKGMQYLRSMVQAERQLKSASAKRSREFLEMLRREYGSPVQVAGNP